jgi:pimeloyl-ACP methyl ester carboxylesterase
MAVSIKMSTVKPSHQPKATTVFLHGFSGVAEGLRPFAELYAGPKAVCINLPGFGGTKVAPGSKNDDLREYSESVWRQIRKEVPKGKIILVGHSHGAMVGYVLAVKYPKEIVRLDLFCPLARPRLTPRFFIGLMQGLRRIGIPAETIIKIGAQPALVSLVTLYAKHPSWTPEDRMRIADMRLYEARYYSPIMFDLMQQTKEFTSLMDKTYCTVPTRICHVNDENAASDDDHIWYEEHCNLEKTQEISGGHLCIVVDPSRVIRLFTEKETA